MCLYVYQNKVTGANKVQYCCKDIQVQQEKNPLEVTLRQPARREAGSWPIFFFIFFLNCREFLLPWSDTLYINRGPPAWCPLYVSARWCTFFLQLFTRLED